MHASAQTLPPTAKGLVPRLGTNLARKCLAKGDRTSLIPRPIFCLYNGAAGKKYDLVLIVYGHVGCDHKFNRHGK